MNNGVFLTLMDLGRYDQGLRTGIWQEWNRRGWFPIVVNSTISYRKALLPWQKFTIETKVLGWDEIAYYIEQRFVRDGEIYARAIMRGRFLKRSWGTLTPQEVMEGSGGWPGKKPVVPKWVKGLGCFGSAAQGQGTGSKYLGLVLFIPAACCNCFLDWV
jgi:acyl-CoA thioesterase FadM